MKRILGFHVYGKSEDAIREQLWRFRETSWVASSAQLDKRIAQLEREIEYYRRRFDEAQERADRQLDEFMQANGMGEVTTTARRDASEKSASVQKEMDAQKKEIGEMFAETLGTEHDEFGLELPEDLHDAAAALMSVPTQKKAS